jgi:hypothetical protein
MQNVWDSSEMHTKFCMVDESDKWVRHHGMVCPQVADGGTASNMKGSSEYIEYAVANSRQGVVLKLGGWAKC